MTLKEFFSEARRVKWRVGRDGLVRCRQGRCPLALVLRTWAPSIAALKGKMSIKTTRKIAAAADGAYHPSRPWLLKNLGITS